VTGRKRHDRRKLHAPPSSRYVRRAANGPTAAEDEEAEVVQGLRRDLAVVSDAVRLGLVAEVLTDLLAASRSVSRALLAASEVHGNQGLEDILTVVLRDVNPIEIEAMVIALLTLRDLVDDVKRLTDDPPDA
jgi:hypothetical protein